MQLYAVSYLLPVWPVSRPHWEYVAETILWFVPVAVDTVKELYS